MILKSFTDIKEFTIVKWQNMNNIGIMLYNIISLSVIMALANAATDSEMRTLLDATLNSTEYSSRVRPIKDTGNVLTVSTFEQQTMAIWKGPSLHHSQKCVVVLSNNTILEIRIRRFDLCRKST